MPATLITLQILLLLLPGYLTLSIRENLAETRVRTELEKVYVILLYDILIFGIYLLVKEALPSLSPFFFSLDKQQVKIVGITLINIIIVFSISILLGILLAEFERYGWGYTVLRRFKLTDKTGRSSVWKDIFSEWQGYYVIIHLEDGLRIFGWISDYPAGSGPKELFVMDARYLGDTPDKDVKIEGPGIFITNEAKVKYIEFLTPEQEG